MKFLPIIACFVFSVATHAAEQVAFDERVAGLLTLAQSPTYDPRTTDALHDGINAVRDDVGDQAKAAQIKCVFDAIAQHAELRGQVVMLTMIMGDETMSENLQRLKQIGYFDHYIVGVLIPTVAAILRPTAGRRAVKEQGTMSIEREPDETDASYQERRDANAAQLEANFQASRAEIYQPLLIEMVQTWVRQAQLHADEHAAVVAAFDAIAGKGRWVQRIGVAK